MINTLKIEGYRTFDDFTISGLNRVNLFVGANNSGKTSVLEALYLLASGGDPLAVFRILVERGEQRFPDFVQQGTMQPELELNHLFHGHDIHVGSSFRLMTENAQDELLEFRIIEAIQSDNSTVYSLFSNAGGEPLGSGIALSVNSSTRQVPAFPSIPLTTKGTLRRDTLQTAIGLGANSSGAKREKNAVQYISSGSLMIQELMNSWNSIVLTKDEDRVVAALKALDPKIERIAAVNGPVVLGQGLQRGGFLIRLDGLEEPVPIGSFGDGVWRMLSLAITLIRARNGVLLVDEIDTGLHYTALADLWKMIIEGARMFDIQVFATTHNTDCIKALAFASMDDDDVSVHRLEQGSRKAINYTGAEARIAAEHNIEVR